MGISPELITEHYSAIYNAGEKHDSPEKSRTSMARRVWELLQNGIPVNRILDIGAGPQILERQLYAGRPRSQTDFLRNFTFHTLDVAEISRRKLLAGKRQNVAHTRANAVSLPYKDGSFGMVVSNHAIDFAPIEDALREAYRVLAAEGIAIFYFHHPDMIPEDLSKVKNSRVRQAWQQLLDTNSLFRNEQQIRDSMTRAGFSEVGVLLATDGIDKWWEVTAKKIE